MYSLFAIFALIPLFFSHFFARLGSGFIFDNGIGAFESVKVHLFLILIVFSIIEFFLFRFESIKTFFSTRYGRYTILGTGIFLIIAFSLYPYDTPRDLLFGVGEKQHGILFVLGLIWLAVTLSWIKERERRQLSNVIIFSGVCVAIIAIIEAIGYNIFTGAQYSVEGTWGDIRSTSTLGNPNYVAGYLLLLFPIIHGSLKNYGRYLAYLVILLGVLSTKSIIGITLMWLYFLIPLLGSIPKKYLIPTVLVALMSLSISLYWIYGESDKLLSLISRGILMQYVLGESISDMGGFLFGHGSDGIIRLFSGVRDTQIDRYFPPSLIIDSSHNIFLDILYAYGCISLIAIFWYVHSQWVSIGFHTRYSIIIVVIFLSLNVVILSHIILVLYLLSENKTQQRSHLLSKIPS